jgi:predicted ArsR family transcriptional regulator
VGRDWGRQLAAAVPPGPEPADTVTAVLAGLGFEPHRVPGPEGVVLHLRTCPFLDLVGQNPDAMCGLHAGVARGVLDQRGAPSDTTILEPFGAPGACVLRLPAP